MIVQAVAVVSAFAIVAQCVCAINHMTIRTRNGVRAAYIGLLLSAAAALLAPLYDAQPSEVDAILLLAVAVFIGVNQRRTYLMVSK